MNDDSTADRPASGSSARSNHQERKTTKQVRKAAAKARAAENMRMVAAAEAAGLVPQKVTRETLGWSSPDRSRARALSVQAAARRAVEPRPPVESRPKRPKPEPVPTPSPAAVHPEAPAMPQPGNGQATTLFDLVRERGLRMWDRTDSGAPAPDSAIAAIIDCPIRFSVENPVAQLDDWTDKCVRPPFDKLWLEYPHLEMLCGALITANDNDGQRFRIQFVTSGRVGSNAPLWWPGPEIAHLAANGSLTHRRPAITDRHNRVAQFQIATMTGVFDSVYIHLALIHEARTRNPLPARHNTTTPVLPAKIQELNGAVILMWGDGSSPSARSPLQEPRHAPVGHRVRGHQRRLRDGGTTWVRPHRRGEGSPEGTRTYQIKQRGNGFRW